MISVLNQEGQFEKGLLLYRGLFRVEDFFQKKSSRNLSNQRFNWDISKVDRADYNTERVWYTLPYKLAMEEFDQKEYFVWIAKKKAALHN